MSLVVGVDVAKFNSMYSFFDTDGSLIEKPFKVDNDVIGLSSILSKIEKAANDTDGTVIIMESTGYFSNRLRNFFLSHQRVPDVISDTSQHIVYMMVPA